MRSRLLLGALVAIVLLIEAASLVVPRATRSSATLAPSCPATAGGLALTRTPSRFEVTVQVTGEERYIVCPYPAPNDATSLTRLMVRWYETPAPPTYACGIPDLNASAGGLPYRYRYSQTNAALVYAQGSAAILDRLFGDGLPMLAAAEAVASGCPRTGAPSAPAATPRPPTPAGTTPVPPSPSPVPVLIVEIAPNQNVEQLIDLLDKGYGTTEKLIEDALNCSRNPKCLGIASDAEIANQKRSAREALARISTQLDRGTLVDTVLEEGLTTLGSLKRADGSPAFPSIRVATPLLALQAVNAKLATDPATKAEAEAELRNTLEEYIRMELTSP